MNKIKEGYRQGQGTRGVAVGAAVTDRVASGPPLAAGLLADVLPRGSGASRHGLGLAPLPRS